MTCEYTPKGGGLFCCSTQALLLTEGSISVVQPASLSDLRNVTVIGLSNNHISELSQEAFRKLPFLHTLLLDHNLLTSQALQGGALTNLSQLEVLALGHNHINMVRIFAGRIDADNPAVTTVLELTEANCIPSNRNITVQIGARGSVTPQMYARDLAITAVICFLDNRPPHKADRDMDNYMTDDELKTKEYETSHCRNCHTTYRPPEQDMTHRRSHSNHKDAFAVNGKAQIQPLQYQKAGLALGGAKLTYQHPFSFSTPDRNRTANLSLLGSAGSQLPGSSLTLQAGNALLNTVASGSNPLLIGGLTNPIAPGVALSGLNIAPSGATESFTRQPSGGIRSSNPALLAKTVQASPLQAGGIHPDSLLSSKPEDPVLSSVNPANIPAVLGHSQMQLDSSASVASLKLDLTQGQNIQTGRGQLHLTTESQAPSTKSDRPEQGQDKMSGDTHQGPEPETIVEDMSTVKMLPGQGVAQTEEPQVGASGECMKAAGMYVMDISLPDLPIQGESSPAAGGTVLLQQEYLLEDGGSSPRRKLRLVLPEKTSNRPPTALERKIR
ncbi:hypothetical protein GOODEAATRI_016724 [Goodea atripinnis]|uniref:C2H2-type domain-containing protein n=1 Tax=Goodea atripinnis TaxID=208336 RepID=A0ABV0NVI4_9TELE